jgi:hypothetical protein
MTVTNIVPPSNSPLVSQLQCTVTPDRDDTGTATVTFYLLNESNSDSQDEVIDGTPAPVKNVYVAQVNPLLLTNGASYSVLVVATLGADSASGCSTNCQDNLPVASQGG